ncbi:MAG: hypothetical protein HFG16_06425, partial [Erysipelotrichaceae bacterium]|nr:hypothetical protein [Erysipelotrichaceae bacterium]
SLPFSSSKWGLPNIAFSFGNNGGMDLMFAAGEPDVHAFTMGSQRPALHRWESCNMHYSSI